MKFKHIQIKIPPVIFDAVYGMETWQKIAVLAVSLVVPLVAFWFLSLGPKVTQLQDYDSRIPRLQREVQLLEIKAQRLPLMKEEYRLMQKILKRALQLLPAQKDIPSVLTQISTIGNEAHLDFISFKPGKEKIKGFYAAIPVTMVVQGTFHNTVSFFDKVTRMARIVHITSVNMGGAKQSKAIMSQTVNSKGNVSPSRMSSGNTGGNSGQNGNWIIRTDCQAVTYRFLSQAEIAKKDKHRKGGHRRR